MGDTYEVEQGSVRNNLKLIPITQLRYINLEIDKKKIKKKKHQMLSKSNSFINLQLFVTASGDPNKNMTIPTQINTATTYS